MTPSEQVKVNTGNTKTMCKICSKLTIKGSCVFFLVQDTILQEWISLLKNCDSEEERFCWLLNNHASDCWRIVPIIVEESCQWLQLYQHYWTIVPATVEQRCKWLVNNCDTDCRTIVPVTVEESCQWLLNNRVSDCSRIVPAKFNDRASDCWRIVPVTVKQLCLWLLSNCASDCWKIEPVIVEQKCQ